MTRARPPFHLAFPVHDLDSAERFYVCVLGCSVGRRSARWIDFSLEGHQLTAHLVERAGASLPEATNPVDGDGVPVRHFGLVLPWERWEALAERLASLGLAFLIAPRTRFQGQVGEQGTFFVQDPSGNALEFKGFRDPAQLFAGG